MNPFAPYSPQKTAGVHGWFGDTLARLMGYDLDEIRREMEEANARLRELNEDLYQRGKISREQRDQMNARLEQEGAVNFSREIEQGFWQGVDEGYRQVASSIRSTLNFGGGLIVSSIPWWVWLLGLGYIAYRFGWYKKLKIT